ncbi:MraY family glycosyltransferase [Paludibaculum fermentans]|uniref:Undecaprenyl/decaprenyl-phosphate alpha-N-acetylglucosaminyl 1-phosphate transferase n=1 Tax=Paludibaculum fermentans TaxID=1473598 RepID=A0A7S7NKQ0_PALFE|nr:MraY family glycosyltransferase [Paludibaculum fermentans]QOY85426.1 undecaprenyl/decaprenyl-phosphate alpha-N-acetylglucosaminyl 1-phosphate transferase [Paludibaculum fermentans]
MHSLLLLGLLSVLLSLVLTPIVASWSKRIGLVDQPDGRRKIHRLPISRVGGIAIALTYVASSCLVLGAAPHYRAMLPEWLPGILRIVPGVALVFLVGLLDDIKGLRPWQKLLGQLVASVWVIGFAHVAITGVRGNPLPGWLSLVLTVVWLLACTNAVNLIDGVDGLASGIGFFATCTTLAAAMLRGNEPLMFATIPLAGALLGFLRYNFNPASIFLGDCGSLTLGFLLGILAILWGQMSATFLGMTAPLMALAVPLLDTTLAIARRYLRQQPIFGADRGHVHHRLLARGLGPKAVTLTLYGVCTFGAALSLAGSTWENYSGLVLLLFCVAAWIGVRKLDYVEFGEAGRMLRQGIFRRLLNRQLILQSFRRQLAMATSLEGCWQAVLSVYHGFGFAAVRASLGGTRFSDGPEAVSPGMWRLWVPVGGSDFVEFYRTNESRIPCSGADELADAINRGMGEKLRQLQVAIDTRGRRTMPPAGDVPRDTHVKAAAAAGGMSQPRTGTTLSRWI